MTRYEPAENVLLTDLGDGTGVLLNLGTRVYYTLNETGMFVWAAMEARACSLDQLVAKLLDEFDVDASEARSDLVDLIAALSDERLVVESSG